MIILMSDADAWVIPFIIMGALLVIGFPFIMRASGTSVTNSSGLFGPSRDFMEKVAYERNMEELKKMNPEIVRQAILNIQKSMYANTSDNILREAKKLKKIMEEGPLDLRIKKKFQDFKIKFNFTNTSIENLEALEKLFNLKEKGIISEEEFEIQKKKLLK